MHILKYKNDKRDFIVKTHEIEIPTVEIETEPPEYDLDKTYNVILCQDTDDITGEVTYLWLEESKDKIVSPRFPTRELAEQWLATAMRNQPR
jgi:hypothetical protein